MITQRRFTRLPQGFTMIEILAVIVIIGLITSIVTLSVENNDAEGGPKKEAALLRQALDYVGERAVLNGEIIGMFVEPKAIEDTQAKQWCYHWQRFRDDRWEDLPKDTLEEHCMAETMQMDLSIEGKLYAFDENLEFQTPVFVWSPSGEATPIVITLFEAGINSEKKIIEIDMMGEIKGPESEEDESDKKR